MEIIKERQCPHCYKKFIVKMKEQRPGYRMLEDELCPYCKRIIRSSLEWEFETDEIH